MGVVFKDKHVTIRKPRQCFGCFEVFQPGTKMNYAAGINDNNDFYAIYLCQTCECIAVYALANEDYIDEGFVIDSVQEFGFNTSKELLAYYQKHLNCEKI